MQTTFVPIRKSLNIVETEARLLGAPTKQEPPPTKKQGILSRRSLASSPA